MLIFHSFKASGSTFSRLHQRLLKSFKGGLKLRTNAKKSCWPAHTWADQERGRGLDKITNGYSLGM